MKIINDSQRQQAMERISNLVRAVEAYDKAKRFHEGLDDLQQEVKGSLDYPQIDYNLQATKVMPGYPHNPNLPRGEDFFSHAKTMPNHIRNDLDGLAAREANVMDPDKATPSETGMSSGRCPI